MSKTIDSSPPSNSGASIVPAIRVSLIDAIVIVTVCVESKRDSICVGWVCPGQLDGKTIRSHVVGFDVHFPGEKGAGAFDRKTGYQRL